MKKTIATVFSGGELVGVGARDAGYEHIWGIENNPEIAEVAKANGFDVQVADILNCNVHDYERPDLFHASPVCTRASIANNAAETNDDGLRESPLDIAMAEKTAEFIRWLKPPTVTIENVQGYKRFKSFALLIRALADCGYMYDTPVLNSADFGVPQTRRRLVVRAVLGGFVPYLPAPVPWIGWYAAIEDILDTLPESQFAEWQLARLPEFFDTDFALQSQSEGKYGRDFSKKSRPLGTITAETNPPKAFLMGDEMRQFRIAASPAVTVRAGENGGAYPRAFLMPSENQSTPMVIDGKTPSNTVVYGKGTYPRAFLVDGQESSTVSGLQILQAADPANTVAASVAKRSIRAWLSLGRVVSVTPRALARFQSMPDSYILPDKKTLAGKIIGNGVPCLMYQRIAEAFQ